MLVDNQQAVVTEVDPSEMALITGHDVPWDINQPLRCHDQNLNIIAAEDTKIWVDKLDDVAPGMTVEQENYVGHLTDLFAKFGDEWTKRWDRHATVDESRWEPITQFADLALPHPPPMPYAPVTIQEWTLALKRKSRKAATGPDGVTGPFAFASHSGPFGYTGKY